MARVNDTPIYLHMPASTTVQTIKSKKVIIKTQGQKTEYNGNFNNSCIWRKASTFIIFKAKEGKDT